ncbi:hypothetical protein WBJ53_21035 [Spirosoma sp. SC4-14]|uniref:anti-sigma factor family protein n=1 Tax=Spirosoma sp. SC4-14 TaxID=3128900 RepID=UPI0030D5B945
MALSEAEFDRIDAFLDGSLPTDERRQMEEDMAQNSELQRAVDEHRVIWEGLQVPVAVEYFQAMHTQLDEQGWLQYDDIWVEVEPSDDDHGSPLPEHHHVGHTDEPEVFVADESTNKQDTTEHTLDVSVTDVSDGEHIPQHTDMSHNWDAPVDPELPHTPTGDSDDFL